MELRKNKNNEINEYVIVYPPIKNISEMTDTKKYLSFFSKTSKRGSLYNPTKNNQLILEEEKENINEKEKEPNEKYNCYLINKDIQLRNNNSKRTQDIKHALENFLRHSDLIENISKLFEEFRDNLMKIKKSKIKVKKERGSIIEEENEKFIEAYIDSIISKLSDHVIIEKYEKNKFIMKMNDLADNCYFLVSGKLSVLKPVEYHIEITYDDYMQYISNLIKNNEHQLIENIRHVNQKFIDVGLVEDLNDFIKAYFIIKLNKDINNLFETNNIDISFIEKRFELFNLSYESFNLSKAEIYKQIDKIKKTSLLIERDLKEYLLKITTPNQEDYSRLEANPNIFKEDKYKVTIFKYEDFLYLKPGCIFGETALENTVHRRNASIRTEEDCIILSLKNEIYKSLLSESNKKLKSFDVIFICKNFFFNDISPIIFSRRYFPLFKLFHRTKDEIIYTQAQKLSSIYFIKEGNVKLEIYVSLLDISNLLKKYFECLTNNNFLKINQNELKEIKENYFEEKNITNIRHQNNIFKQHLKKKKKFELYSSDLFDTLGLEEFFLNNDYISSCKVISKNLKIFEISTDNLNLILSSEKQIHSSYYDFIGRKIISLIKRLHTLKINYINQLNYKIKENFFGTEMPQDHLIKGQTGGKKPFTKSKKTSGSKIIKSYKNNLTKEELKNDYLSFNKNYLKTHTRNIQFWNNQDFNTINFKKKESLTYDNNLILYNKKYEKNKKIKIQLSQDKISKQILDNNIVNSEKYNFYNESHMPTQINKNNEENSIDNDKEKERTKRIMETTIIKVGHDYLSLKEIGNRLKNATTTNNNNSQLSIVKNCYYKTYTKTKNNSFGFNSSDKKHYLTNKTENNFRNNIDINCEPFSLKENIMSLTSKSKNLYNNKLPHIAINTYNNFSDLLNRKHWNYYNKYNMKNLKNKFKSNLFKSTKIFKTNYIYNSKHLYNKTFFDPNKKRNSFNVILTNDNNPTLRDKSKGKSSSNKKK